jgi:uncharacterized BrkB/YihY/UPF0761 family membrane protein
VLIFWLYWAGFAVLIGGRLNALLARASSKGELQEKLKPSAYTTLDLAA